MKIFILFLCLIVVYAQNSTIEYINFEHNDTSCFIYDTSPLFNFEDVLKKIQENQNINGSYESILSFNGLNTNNLTECIEITNQTHVFYHITNATKLLELNFSNPQLRDYIGWIKLTNFCELGSQSADYICKTLKLISYPLKTALNEIPSLFSNPELANNISIANTTFWKFLNSTTNNLTELTWGFKNAFKATTEKYEEYVKFKDESTYVKIQHLPFVTKISHGYLTIYIFNIIGI